MEQYAHIAECQIGANRSFAIAAPSGVILDNLFADLLLFAIRTNGAVARFNRNVVFVQGMTRSIISERLTTHFSFNVCPICITPTWNPCWHWRHLNLSDWPEGTHLLRIAQAIPVSQEAVEAALREARGGNTNALSQIQSTSATVRSALASAQSTPQSAPRRAARPRESYVNQIMEETPTSIVERSAPVARPTAAATTAAVVGTHRCGACGQVIPPGFDRKTDTNKTENEIYESCEHDFDEQTNHCKKCKLLKRAGWFSLLEVD